MDGTSTTSGLKIVAKAQMMPYHWSLRRFQVLMAVASRKRTPSGRFSVNNWSTAKSSPRGILIRCRLMALSPMNFLDDASLPPIQVLSSQSRLVSAFLHNNAITTSSNASELMSESSVSLNVRIAIQIIIWSDYHSTVVFTIRMLPPDSTLM